MGRPVMDAQEFTLKQSGPIKMKYKSGRNLDSTNLTTTEDDNFINTHWGVFRGDT